MPRRAAKRIVEEYAYVTIKVAVQINDSKNCNQHNEHCNSSNKQQVAVARF